MKKGIKCVVAKEGRVLMANNRVARKFGSKLAAKNFISNLNRVSKRLRLKDFECIAI